MPDDLATRVGKAIDEMRPYLQRSGADLRLVGVEDGVARVVAEYGRGGYLLSNLSFVAGIERALMDKVPGLRGVEPVNLPPYSGVGWDKRAFADRIVAFDPKKLNGEP
jgi:Fe-S cluster biogenesis protein NfuA